MKKLILFILVLFFVSCETRTNDVENLSDLAGFYGFFTGYMRGRLVYARANNKTKYQWAKEARDSYMISVGHITAAKADEYLTKITNSWTNNEKEKQDKSHSNIIVYSGGYDSTLVIQELLKKYPRTQFTIVGYNINYFNPNKNRAENLYRAKFIDYLYNDAKIKNFDYVQIDTEKTNDAYKPMEIYRKGGLVQQPYFVFMTSFFAPSQINHIFTGFHNGDCYFNWVDSFKDIIKAMSEIMGKEIYFHHPLAKTDKYSIIKAVQSAGLEEFCFTCEAPKGYFEPCGECKPCTELIMANKRINHSRRKKIDVHLDFDTEDFDKYWKAEKE